MQLCLSNLFMRLIILKFSPFLILISFLISCETLHKMPAPSFTGNISRLKFLGEKVIPFNLSYKNTTVGGLSSIDFDSAHQVYYMISDDRSAINPARFYTAKIVFTQNGIDTIQFTDVKNMLQPGGSPYPNNKQDPSHTPDPEAMRYNPATNQLIWSSEGERIVRDKDTVLENPSIIMISPDGKYLDSFAMPPNLNMQSIEKGPRQNGTLEGLTFADNFKTLFASVEEPLYEDGPRADITDNNAFIRILKFDIETKKNTAQYAYKLEPIAYPANPTTAFKINGVPDLLSLGNNKFLVIERSYSSGRLPCTIKVFITDLNVATDVQNLPLMNAADKFTPASKKLLLNMDALGIYTDNIEGVTFGPTLPNGHRTLLFIADNNFTFLEKSQLLLFEVIE